MFRTLRSFLATAAIGMAFLSTLGTLNAQTGERSRWDQVTLGNNYVGVDVIGWARTRNTGSERRVDEAAWIQLRLLNVNVELQRIAATAVKNGASFAASSSLRRGGLTMRYQSSTATATHAYTSSGSVFGSNPTATVWIFGIPITVGANVGHTGVMNTTLTDWTYSNASTLSGFMESYAYGWGALAIGVPGLQAGVQANINIGHQRFDGVLGAFTNYLSTAYLGYTMTPIRLFLSAFLDLGPLTGSVTLVDVAIGSRQFLPFIP